MATRTFFRPSAGLLVSVRSATAMAMGRLPSGQTSAFGFYSCRPPSASARRGESTISLRCRQVHCSLWTGEEGGESTTIGAYVNQFRPKLHLTVEEAVRRFGVPAHTLTTALRRHQLLGKRAAHRS